MTTTAMTYGKLEEIYGRLYEQLREDNNENAPDSNVYYASTLEALADEATNWAEEIAEVQQGETEPEVIGDPDSATVAWAIELSAFYIYRITESACENELVEFFGKCMGYEL